MKAAIINELNNEVVNIIELEKNSKWEIPSGYFIKYSEQAAIGMFWDSEKFVDKNPLE